ncbi:hypothetical protein P5V15_007717 [Pogonomyrmex californicus]
MANATSSSPSENVAPASRPVHRERARRLLRRRLVGQLGFQGTLTDFRSGSRRSERGASTRLAISRAPSHLKRTKLRLFSD